MNVVLYARVSSEKQAEKDLSLPAQLKSLRDYALRKEWTIVHEYVDAAESARSADRPQFQEMIATAKQKDRTFEAILVWKLKVVPQKAELIKRVFAMCLKGNGAKNSTGKASAGKYHYYTCQGCVKMGPGHCKQKLLNAEVDLLTAEIQEIESQKTQQDSIILSLRIPNNTPPYRIGGCASSRSKETPSKEEVLCMYQIGSANEI